MTAVTFPRSNLGKILNYLLLSSNMDQKWLAECLSISPSKVSRMINGTISPGIEFWHKVSVMFGINFDAIQTGIITTYEQDSDLVLKRLAPLRKNNFTLGNALMMHKSVFIHYWGEDKFNEFCHSLKINPMIFVNANNPSNLDFTLRMIQYSILKGKIKSLADIESYANLAYDSLSKRERLHFLYSKTPSVEKVANFISNIEDQYEKNHHYQVEDLSIKEQWIEISFWPKEHVDLQFYIHDPILGNSYEKYVQFYLARFMNAKSTQTQQSLFKGDSKCTFRLQRL
ncbi:MAG TPA: helix-turn-helix transcriptional regulator [Bacteriovoracaceae bacterium]|nr:helix-turn-helix transcriptional regulator [Bacteriovoracaceae bacterium]